MRRSHMAAILFGALTAACSSNPAPATAPQPAAPAAAPAPPAAPPAPPAPPAGAVDLSGSWNMSVDAGGQTIAVDVTLARGTAGYTGEAVPAGQAPASLSALTIQGDRVSMTFDAPEGQATFNGTLSPDRRSISGSLAYQGQNLPFTMTKR